MEYIENNLVLQSIFSYPETSAIYSSVMVSNIDPASTGLELAFGSWNGGVFLTKNTGEIYDGWPVESGGPYPMINFNPLTSGDIDNDGELEVLINSEGSNGIYAYNKDGSLVDGFPINLGRVYMNSPTVSDIDNDGGMELLLLSEIDGLLSIVDTSIGFSDHPSFHCNVHHTGSYIALPSIPCNPYPRHESNGISINTDLSWIKEDLDIEKTVTYDIYFGTSNNPPCVKTNQGNTVYSPDNLELDKTYFWKIVSKDNQGRTTTGPIWTFTTTAEQNDIKISLQSLNINELPTTIKNLNDHALTDISWDISIEGGILLGINISENGVIENLGSNSDYEISFGEEIFGLGLIKISITIDVAGKTYRKTANGFIFGRLIIIG